MTYSFGQIKGKTAEIIEAVMVSPEMPLDEILLLRIRLCVEEAVTNIVNYAYGDEDGWLEIQTSDDDGMLSITLKDAGVPFDPLSHKDPDITLSAQDREIGGLGILLCKKIMDTVEYIREDGCNILKMTIKAKQQ